MINDNDRREIERANAALMRRRAAAGVKPSRGLSAAVKLRAAHVLSPAHQKRLTELEAVALAEIRAVAESGAMEKAEPELFAGIVKARARRMLDVEIDPEEAALAEQARRDNDPEEQRARIEEARLLRQGFPDDAVEIMVRGTEDGEHVAIVDDVVDHWLAERSNKRLLALLGVLGTGKTLAACRWADQHGPAMFVRACEVYALSPKFSVDRERLDAIERAPMLIIDEMMTTAETQADSAQLSTLLQSRFAERRKTIAIGNGKLSEFVRRYGEVVESRMYQSGGYLPCSKIMRRGEILRQRRRTK